MYYDEMTAFIGRRILELPSYTLNVRGGVRGVSLYYSGYPSLGNLGAGGNWLRPRWSLPRSGRGHSRDWIAQQHFFLWEPGETHFPDQLTKVFRSIECI